MVIKQVEVVIIKSIVGYPPNVRNDRNFNRPLYVDDAKRMANYHWRAFTKKPISNRACAVDMSKSSSLPLSQPVRSLYLSPNLFEFV
jgi:hypothetical protein